GDTRPHFVARSNQAQPESILYELLDSSQRFGAAAKFAGGNPERAGRFDIGARGYDRAPVVLAPERQKGEKKREGDPSRTGCQPAAIRSGNCTACAHPWTRHGQRGTRSSHLEGAVWQASRRLRLNHCTELWSVWPRFDYR